MRLLLFTSLTAALLIYGGMVGLMRGHDRLFPLMPIAFVDAYYTALGIEPLVTRDPIQTSDIIRIAHAAGEFEGSVYRNDMPALEANRKHFRLFEIDFILTLDGKIVCLHDWGPSFQRLWAEDEERLDLPLNFKEFKDITREAGCWPSRVATFLKNNPSRSIVTDFKGHKSQHHNVLSLLGNQIQPFKNESYTDQIIPQIYHPSELSSIKNIGFEKVIWTLYRSNYTDQQILRHLRYLDIWAVTMPVNRVTHKFLQELNSAGVYAFTHPVDDCGNASELVKAGVNGVYTKNIGYLVHDAKGNIRCEYKK